MLFQVTLLAGKVLLVGNWCKLPPRASPAMKKRRDPLMRRGSPPSPRHRQATEARAANRWRVIIDPMGNQKERARAGRSKRSRTMLTGIWKASTMPVPSHVASLAYNV
jgi:hypothetical protein